MGDLKSLMGMIPGFNKLTQNIDIDDKAFSKVESIIQSMTPQERANPDILSLSRKQRIARGCGRDMSDIHAFVKQFEQMRKMMHRMSKMPGMGMTPAAGGGVVAPKQGYRAGRKRR
jgi:signal recognition particle subunit SRP54